jgi:hypothetical protein
MGTGISWSDVKPGARMLIKHPGPTLAAGLGVAGAITLSAGFFAFPSVRGYPTLPLDEGERIVALENRNPGLNNEERRVLHDFLIQADCT